MRILITGATGFIGGALARRLAAAGHTLRCLARSGADLTRLPAEAAVVEGGMADTDILAREIAALVPGDAVIHLAGVTKAFNERGFFHANENLTRGLVECARDHGPEGLLFLHVSSQAAMGPCAQAPGIGEAAQPAPVSQYGLSKLLGERAALSLAPRYRVAVVRPCMVYGPGDHAFAPLYRLMAHGLLTVSGSPGQRLSIVHVDDLVDGMLLALDALRQGRAAGAYHLAGPEDMDWRAYATAFGAALGRKHVRILRAPAWLTRTAAWANVVAHACGLPTSHFTPDKGREARQDGWLLDCARARRELGYTPLRGLTEGAAETIAWCREQSLLPPAPRMQRRNEARHRLAVLLQDLEYGGTQRFALNLLKDIDRARFEPELWVLNSGNALEPEARTAGIRILQISRRPPGSALAVFSLARALFRRRPDVLFTLTVVPNIWGRLFGRLAGVTAIVSGYRGLNPKQWEGLLWRFSDHVICNAEALRRRMVETHGVPPDRIRVIPNCVNAQHFTPGPRSSTPTIISVARLVKDKAPLVLAEAFALVRQQIPGAQLMLVGEGPLRAAFEARLKKLGVAEHVHIVSGCGDPAPRLSSAHVFVLASVREGSPNAILEAMATGLPVVACRTGGIPELVCHGETGLLTEPNDAASLALALVTLLRDTELAARMGRAGRERVLRSHSAEAMVHGVERVLQEALDARRRP